VIEGENEEIGEIDKFISTWEDDMSLALLLKREKVN